MSNFSIPWKCLDADLEPKSNITSTTKTPKTFAQAVSEKNSNLCEIPQSKLPQAVLKGDGLAIQIPEEEYTTGMDCCKFNLHGRVLWQKGSSPLSVVSLKAKLSLIWKGLARWGIQTLGKGYFEFTFTKLEDVRRVRSVASWNLNPGFLKLFAWSSDFSPRYQNNTNAQVWVRIYGLPQEYWRKNILFSIVSGVGSPICTDNATGKPMIERTFGHYARVLVDMDLSQTLRYTLLVERVGFAFYVDLDYENLPDFCTHCRNIGHHIDICKKWYPEGDQKVEKQPVQKKNQVTDPKKVYVQTKDGRSVPSKNDITIELEKEVINVEEKNATPQPEEDAEDSTRRDADKGKAPEHISTPVEVFRDQDLNLEAELNLNMDKEGPDSNNQESDSDFSSSATQGSFVDATQDQEPVHENPENTTIPTPVRVLKDMEFLQKSWATMNQEDEEEIANTAYPEQLQGDAQTFIDKDGFKMVVPKSKKKVHTKRTNLASVSHKTRSKVSPKPFK